jgi:hypothetical protein
VEVLMRREAVDTAVSRFVELPTVQRSVVILKDVLDQSLEVIAALLGRPRTELMALSRALPRARWAFTALTGRRIGSGAAGWRFRPSASGEPMDTEEREPLRDHIKRSMPSSLEVPLSRVIVRLAQPTA